MEVLSLKKMKKFFKKYKKGIKYSYISIMVLFVIYALYNIWQQVSWEKIVNIFSNISVGKSILIVILGLFSVIPMVIYDYVYTRKTKHQPKFLPLLKNSYIVNTFTNAGGGGGTVGASLRVSLFGKASQHLGEIFKILAQIALFTITGLITNDILAIILNWKNFPQLPLRMKVCCLLFLLYIIVPFIIPSKKLNFKDHILLILGSSLEWFCALVFFLIAGLIIGIKFNIIKAYLAVCFAGIIGAITLIPGGVGTFDSSLILGMHQLGISTNVAVVWALIYRLCYYIIPLFVGIILLLITMVSRKLRK